MRILTILSLAIGMTVFCGAAWASPDAAVGKPDIVVVVYSNIPGQPDQVGLTYPHPTPHPQVQRDLAQIQTQTGWAESNIKITDPVVQPGQTMTSAQFDTKSIVAPGSSTLPLSQFVVALRSYNHVALTYFLGQQIQFQGLRDYRDSNVDVHFAQQGITYTYHIRILNPNFDRLNLPLYQPAQEKVAVAPPVRERRIRPWQVMLLALAAAGAEIAVYFITSRRP